MRVDSASARRVTRLAAWSLRVFIQAIARSSHSKSQNTLCKLYVGVTSHALLDVRDNMSIPADIPPYELTELVPDFLKVYCNSVLPSYCLPNISDLVWMCRRSI